MTLNAKIVKNNNVTFTITALNASGVAINITGYTIKYQIKKSKDDAALLTKTTSSGITIPTGTDGKFVVAIDDSDTASIPPGTYIHEAVLLDTLGNYVTLTNDDDDITFGSLTIREQYTIQGA